uniref:Ground-like domain-containing protein n=1 Tax=Caenorhabditis japonica TaxID=281687 RepID=A0A8R1DHD8_CAEJA
MSLSLFYTILLSTFFISSLAAIFPLPSPPNPIPEPPTATDVLPLATTAADKKSVHPVSINRVRLHSHSSKVSKNREVEILDEKCNDEHLQRIMEDAITPSLSTSKMVISERSARDFGSSFDVICAKGHFSYYVEASTYCEVTLNDVTCFAYRSSDEDKEKTKEEEKEEESD